jgi:hypothetical protein
LIVIGDVGYSENVFTSSGPTWFVSKLRRGEPIGAYMATAYLHVLLRSSGALPAPNGYRIVEVMSVPVSQARLRRSDLGRRKWS